MSSTLVTASPIASPIQGQFRHRHNHVDYSPLRLHRFASKKRRRQDDDEGEIDPVAKPSSLSFFTLGQQQPTSKPCRPQHNSRNDQTGETKRVRLPRPTDADGLLISPHQSSRPVPMHAVISGQFPVAPATPISQIPFLSPDSRVQPTFPSTSPSVLSFDNSSAYVPNQSAFLLIVPGRGPVTEHVWTVCAMLPHVLSLAPTIQPLILNPHSRPTRNQYPIPSVSLDSRSGPNPLLYLGLLNPGGGSLSSSAMPAIALVDRHMRRRMVVPVGWGAGRMWPGFHGEYYDDDDDDDDGDSQMVYNKTTDTHGGLDNPLAGLLADVSASEIARRLMASLASGIEALERETAAELAATDSMIE